MSTDIEIRQGVDEYLASIKEFFDIASSSISDGLYAAIKKASESGVFDGLSAEAFRGGPPNLNNQTYFISDLTTDC